MTREIKPFDVICCKPGSPDYKSGTRWTGFVTSATPGNSVYDHGGIEIFILSSNEVNMLPAGDLEHYCYFEWEKYLEVMDEKVTQENLIQYIHLLQKNEIQNYKEYRELAQQLER